MSGQMRIIDLECHPVAPAGVMDCFPEGQPMRYPHVLPAPVNPQSLGGALARGEFSIVADHLLAVMDRHGVERSVVMRGPFPTLNADLSEIVHAHPDRFTAFAAWDLHGPQGVPPHLSSEAVSAVEHGLEELGMAGVGELALQYFYPLPPEWTYTGLIPVFEVARRHGSPVYFHTSHDGFMAPMAYKSPALLEPLAACYPTVPIIVGHMGRQDVTFLEGALMLARSHRNVYLQTASSRPEFVERAVEEVGAERILFGSDYSEPHWAVAHRAGVDLLEHSLDIVRRARISDRDKELILGLNAVQLLGL